MVGEVLANRYRVVRLLGEGAMGQVWLVEDTTTSHEVALKVISRRLGGPARSHSGQSSSQPSAERSQPNVDRAQHAEKSQLEFIQEFRLMTQLRHQNCCEVLDYGLLVDDAPYLTMEVVPGRGLDELGPVAGDTFDRLFSQILLALGYIHSRGFVHCDLKPANVRVRSDGVVKLMDYGLMAYAGESGGPIKGTLAYLAPEMIKRGLIDQRTDLYSLGVLGYEMLTGRWPFVTDRPGDMLRAHVAEPPAPPSAHAPGIDPRHERVVMKLLAKEPIDRYQSADAVLEDLGFEVTPGLGGSLLTSPLMGRAQEMAKLFVQLARITSGKKGGALLVSGPAGIGKSRLIKEFSFNARLENLPYAEGANHEFARSPYGPILALLRGLLPALRELVPEHLERLGRVLVKLLPELAVPPAPDLDAGNEKLRLQAAITEIVGALAARRGTVVVVEDVQWADPLSVEVLEHLLRSLREAPVLFLLTTRPADGAAPTWQERATRLPLAPLGEGGLKRMVVSMLGTPEVEPTLLARLSELSGGNPRHVEMLLEHLVKSGLLVKAAGRWSLTAELTAERLPDGLRGLLLRKISDLPTGAQAVARAAAVVGYDISLDLLREVAELPEAAFLEALDPLLAGQILVPGEDGAYAFEQDQLQDLMYVQIGELDRARLHARVAAVLERRAGGLSVQDLQLEELTAIADHYVRGDEPAKTIAYALEAGIRFAGLFANSEAQRYLEAGLALAADVNAGPHMAVGFLRALGDVHRMAGHGEAAREAYERAVPLAEALGDRFLLGRVLTALAAAYQGLDQLEQALGTADRAQRVCLDAEDQGGAARAALVAGRTLVYLGRTGEALNRMHDSLELARQAFDQPLVGEALADLGYMQVALLPDGLEAGVDALNESIDLLTELGDKRGQIRAHTMLGQAHLALGDAIAARTAFGQAEMLCQEVGDQLEACAVTIQLALADLELGEFARAAEGARTGTEEAVRLGSTFQMGIGLMTEAVADVWQGRFGEAQALMSVAFDQAAEVRHALMETRMLQLQGDALAYMGRFEAAMAASERLQAAMVETGNLEPQGRLCALWGEVLARGGDGPEAREYLDKALAIAEAGQARGTRLRALRSQARVAILAEEWAEAEALCGVALPLAEELGARHVEAELRGLRGEVALAAHGPGAAEEFASMAAIAEGLGTPLLLAEALFGQAAAEPYAPEAATRAARAREVLEAALAPLDDEARAACLVHAERRRVLAGNYIDFSLPRVAQKSVSPPALRPGLWGGMM